MFNYQCRFCRSRMQAYIDGDLPANSRRRVARHLDECASCYAKYVSQREVAGKLAHRLPLIGQPQAAQLQRIWTSIQADMCPPPRQLRRQHTARFGFVAIMLVFMLVLPLTLGNQNLALSVPSQPAPATAVTKAPNSVEMRYPVTVALVLTDESAHIQRISLRNTPEPQFTR